MKVVIDAMLLGPRRTGVELSILHLLEGLATRGEQDYRVFVSTDCRETLPATPRMTVRRIHVPSHLRPLRIGWEQLALPRAARREACDLLHAPGYLAPLSCRVPVVLTVYDAMALARPELCRIANRWNYRALLPASIRGAAAIIVPSRHTASELASVIPEAGDKTHVIPLAVSDAMRREASAADIAATRQRLGLPDTFILFVGREEPKKEIPTLLDAFKLLKRRHAVSRHLVITGPHGPASNAIRHRITEAGLGESVTLTGTVRDDDLRCLYRMASAFAFPSRYEGFGLPPLEAMANGVPVVCSNAAALPETVGDDALTVPAGDAPALADALHRVLTDGDLRERLRAGGRERAAGRLWADIAAETEQVYAEVLAQQRTRETA